MFRKLSWVRTSVKAVCITQRFLSRLEESFMEITLVTCECGVN